MTVCVCLCVLLVVTSLQDWSMELSATVGIGSPAHGLQRKTVVWCVGVREAHCVEASVDSPFTRWRSSSQGTGNVSQSPPTTHTQERRREEFLKWKKKWTRKCLRKSHTLTDLSQTRSELICNFSPVTTALSELLCSTNKKIHITESCCSTERHRQHTYWSTRTGITKHSNINNSKKDLVKMSSWPITMIHSSRGCYTGFQSCLKLMTCSDWGQTEDLTPPLASSPQVDNSCWDQTCDENINHRGRN